MPKTQPTTRAKDLTASEIHKLIAENRGWSGVGPKGLQLTTLFGWPPGRNTGLVGDKDFVPLYTESLDAMHALEVSIGLLNDDFHGRKMQRAWTLACPAKDPRFANARQRAETFCIIMGLALR